jgi:hypothetical protein
MSSLKKIFNILNWLYSLVYLLFCNIIIYICSADVPILTLYDFRPIESKSAASVEGYVPPAPIPSLGTTGYRQHGPPGN